MEDPQSLHKYLYVHGDPVNGIDATGLFSVNVSLGTITVASSITAIDVGATVFVIKSVYDLVPKTDPLLRRITEGLGTKIRTKKDIETERDRNPNYMYFVHGSSSGAWSLDDVTIDPTAGNPRADFGFGFYTFRATSEGLVRARERAIETSQRRGTGGTPFMLVVRMLRANWNRLRKQNYGTRYTPTASYLPDVNAFKAGTRQPFTGKDVAFGAVAKRAVTGAWTWIARPEFPEQFKFETFVGVSQLEPVGAVPIITTYFA
jgi:hypothetical protein